MLLQLLYARYNTSSAYRHPTFGKTKRVVVYHDIGCRQHWIKIQQRLTHAHEYHIGYHFGFRSQVRVGDCYLSDDLLSAKVAVEALFARGAEAAVEDAAYLG